MAYKKRTTKKRTALKKRSVKTAPKRRAATSKATALRTDYARAVLDPKNGPLVGVPQFVPIDTHRARVKLIATDIKSTTGKLDLMFNPVRMVASDTGPLRVYARNNTTGAVDDAAPTATKQCNAEHTAADFQITTEAGQTIDNGDGVRARVVGCVLTVTNTTNGQDADGTFIALHEKHHKTLENFSPNDMANQANAIVKRCGSGTSVSLLYRPVKPEEVEEWQRSAYKLMNEISVTTGAQDGTLVDANPGYMRVCWDGTATTSNPQSFMVQAHAIIEYCGESVTTLARPIGGRNPAKPADVTPIANQAGKNEKSGTEPLNPDEVQATLDTYGVHAANESAATTKYLQDAGVTTGRNILGFTAKEAEKLAVDVIEPIQTHIDARLIEASGKVGVLPSEGHPKFAAQAEAGLYEANAHLRRGPNYLKEAGLEDYYAVAASNNGRHVIWSNTRNGESTICAVGTKFTTTQGAKDIAQNWPGIARGGHAASEHVAAMKADIVKAKDLAEQSKIFTGTIALRKDVRLLGHSQGGSTVVEIMKDNVDSTIEGVAFNPGVGVHSKQALADVNGLVVHRTHTDVASVLDHFHDSRTFKDVSNPFSAGVETPLLSSVPRNHAAQLMEEAQLSKKVQNVGLKQGTRGIKDVVTGGHELSQWHFTDAEVAPATREMKALGRVGVKRLPMRATLGKAAGPILGIGLTAWEAGSDMKRQKTKRGKVATGVADVALAAAEWAAIGAAATAGGLPLALAAGIGDAIIHGTAKKYAQKATKATAKFIDHGLKKTEHEVKKEARKLWRGFKKLFKHKRRPRNKYRVVEDIIGVKRRHEHGGRRTKPRIE